MHVILSAFKMLLYNIMTTFPLGEADYYSILAKDSMYFYNTTYNVKQFMGTTNNLIQGAQIIRFPLLQL